MKKKVPKKGAERVEVPIYESKDDDCFEVLEKDNKV